MVMAAAMPFFDGYGYGYGDGLYAMQAHRDSRNRGMVYART
jgi:hypothetical protein